MKSYDTLSEAIADLTRLGYNLNFNLMQDCITCKERSIHLHPEEFQIDAWYRFQEMSDVDNETILYAISSSTHRIKGLMVNAFGIYADTTSGQMAEKLLIRSSEK